MKKIFLSALVFALHLTFATAQTDRQAIQYQAIARDKNQKPLAGADVSIEAKIFKNNAQVYSEKVDKKTAATGLFTLEIGRGNAADFQKIDWSSGDFELEISVSGAVNLTSRSPILSVPFAFRAANLESNGATGGQVLKWDATAQKWLPAKDETGSGNDANLEDLKDVDLAGLQTGQVLKWDATAQKWLPAKDETGSGGDVNLEDLKDVDLAGLQTGQVLKWDAVLQKWTPEDDIGGGMGDDWGSDFVRTDSTLVGKGTAGEPLTIAQQNAQQNQFLKWNGTTWQPADVDVSIFQNSITTTEIKDNSITINDLNFSVPQKLDELKDVDLSNLQTGQVLKWDAVLQKWTPEDDIGGGMGDDWGSQTVQTSNKITGDGTAGNPLSIAQNAIGSAEIANGSISAADLAAGVSLPPSGAAGNDLSGTYPNPTVARLRGQNISQTLPQQGDILMFDGGEWKPQAASSGGGGIPVGTILPFGGTGIPSGYFLCDGTAYDPDDYPELFAVIGNAWGGNSFQFNVPDLRGRFLRGVDEGAGRDPDVSSRSESTNGGQKGDRVGSVQEDALQAHYHEVKYGGVNVSGGFVAAGGQSERLGANLNAPVNLYADKLAEYPSYGMPRFTSETRPKNAYVRFIIKY